jgi:hypothetical protein
MDTTKRFERCREFIESQSAQPRATARGARRPFVTISRQAGAASHSVAEALAPKLQSRGPRGAGPWEMFDRNLVERVLQEHGLPERLAAFMPEDRISAMSDMMDELFGFHPSALSLVRKTADTILHLAQLGNVILIGRGSNVITRQVEDGFHVRLVGSREARIRRVRQRMGLDGDEASEYVRRVDLGRARYVKKYYGRDIDDPLLYHVVINTDRLSVDEVAEIIADAVMGPAVGVTHAERPLVVAHG